MASNRQTHEGDFSDVDRAGDPRHCLGYLDTVSTMSWFQAYKQQTFALLDLHEGDSVLDVGCGTGEDAQALAKLVGRTGRVVAVDSSALAIGEARARASGLGISVEFSVCDAHRLDFADGTFDGCRVDRVLQHLADPRGALGEMVRVARAGARIVAFDPDWETLVVDAPDRAVTRRILNLHCDTVLSGWIGRQLPGLFRELGLAEVEVGAHSLLLYSYAEADPIFWLASTAGRAQALGLVSAADAASWLEGLQEADRAGRFFSAGTCFLVSGRKP